jgi:hypothetical protein
LIVFALSKTRTSTSPNLINQAILKLGIPKSKVMTANLRQRLQTLIEALPEASLLQAETLLTALNPTTPANAANPTQEESLIAIIQRRLSPQDQQRLNTLRLRLADETITPAEQQELLDWVEPIEQMDVERAEAMIQLAQLRHIRLEEVIQEFLPHPQPTHAL